MKRKFMSRKGGKKDKTKRKTKFGVKKKLTKSRINTKIGTKMKSEEIEVPKIENFFNVKFEVTQDFPEQIFPVFGVETSKGSLKTVKKFRIPIPSKFYKNLKMTEIKNNFKTPSAS